MAMHLTIFETGRPPEPIRGHFASYPSMLQALLAPHVPSLSCEVVQVLDGQKQPDPSDVEAALITGSPAGVYDDFTWIADLKDWIRRAGDQRVPQVGICFGHQLMAEAFGGRAHKAPQGWGLGRHTYHVAVDEPWMGGTKQCLHLAVSHQDQVLEAPSTARVLAQSDFTPYAALVYDHVPALSFQGHPEFCPRFADALIRSRRGTRFSEEMADAALASLEAPLDGDVVAAWVAGFFAHTLREKYANLGRAAA
ncbi:MAG: gamma-glutamyl-gamma-aminobutyrate hydrolase family protein [Hyphomonadaceae bacterium]|jgi:GMP synthase-like glutamine amidotransferase|nr:gamma-glutamyl-gamma-aminobutyrate hydrolase family protein [Hyphomonadaceae bacterium]